MTDRKHVCDRCRKRWTANVKQVCSICLANIAQVGRCKKFLARKK